MHIYTCIICGHCDVFFFVCVSVVFHHGKKATGGHYTTDVFHPGINGWVHMDDSRILPVQEIDVLNYHPPKMPYLLYYRRRDLATSS